MVTMASTEDRTTALEQLADLLVAKPKLLDDLRKIADSNIDLTEVIAGHEAWLDYHERWIRNSDPHRVYEPTEEHPEGVINAPRAPRGQRIRESSKGAVKSGSTWLQRLDH
jgi:hypothetical protein